MLKMNTIVCPTDFSAASSEALDYAAGMAEGFGAELFVLHVTQPVQPMMASSAYPDFVAFDTSRYEDVIRANAETQLRDLLNRPALAGIKVRSEVRRGYPADEIVQAAADAGADLIVIATHGETGWRRYIFGSVTEKVLHQAHCPVLVAPTRETEGA